MQARFQRHAYVSTALLGGCSLAILYGAYVVRSGWEVQKAATTRLERTADGTVTVKWRAWAQSEEHSAEHPWGREHGDALMSSDPEHVWCSGFRGLWREHDVVIPTAPR